MIILAFLKNNTSLLVKSWLVILLEELISFGAAILWKNSLDFKKY